MVRRRPQEPVRSDGTLWYRWETHRSPPGGCMASQSVGTPRTDRQCMPGGHVGEADGQKEQSQWWLQTIIVQFVTRGLNEHHRGHPGPAFLQPCRPTILRTQCPSDLTLALAALGDSIAGSANCQVALVRHLGGAPPETREKKLAALLVRRAVSDRIFVQRQFLQAQRLML